MPRFKIVQHCNVNFTRVLEIEADDEDEAIDIADEENEPDGDFDDWQRGDFSVNQTTAEELEGDDEAETEEA
jgi:hypothetical protein